MWIEGQKQARVDRSARVEWKSESAEWRSEIMWTEGQRQARVEVQGSEMWRSEIVRIESQRQSGAQGQRQGGQEWRGKKKKKKVWNGGNRKSETGQRQGGMEVRDSME